ncbi:hypothetical protein M3A96_02785 [Helcobacillus massiliensis]|uniref:Uncharacterized protein n=1 Tax=Helcobacillus massiliensis TaxID=521392 RepID=A0A839QRX4_9MICO|nr:MULTISPECIES: hypothetical protein [Helcobacillus]MBB3022418.1 hypothetical protein [Helcobacillus massiliensis]MCG7426939.1 hypothetical protein [Helcobacillus sp. ACRRO]MCT1557054.1 hypothetical protein [Helcobacillus massiliensis]MCT2035443.1 hypothetical protein [Helcobacillus massiliensis]MCT2331342.1 hypothetical protein [Helcobacillus massiliensis]
MSRFNPAPAWPEPPSADWEPPAGWVPPADWPTPPAGWRWNAEELPTDAPLAPSGSLRASGARLQRGTDLDYPLAVTAPGVLADSPTAQDIPEAEIRRPSRRVDAVIAVISTGIVGGTVYLFLRLLDHAAVLPQ